jgi:hypothetical protein
MSLQNALLFIRNVGTNKSLRKACYGCRSKADLLELLDNEGIGFSENEFEEAITMSLFKCQTYEAADDVKQVEIWFNLFT